MKNTGVKKLRNIMGIMGKSIITSMIFLMLLLFPHAVKADSNLRQTAMTENTATIVWNPDWDASSYEIYYYDYSWQWKGTTRKTVYTYKYAGTTTSNSFTMTGLSGGKVYETYVIPVDRDGNSEIYYQENVKTSPAPVDRLATSIKWSSYYGYGSKMTLEYNLYVDFAEQDSADGYEIALYNLKGKRIKTAKAAANNAIIYRHTFYGLENNAYIIRVRAYSGFGGVVYYGEWSEKHYVLRQPQSMAKSSAGKVYLKWEKISGATGYDVYMSDRKNGNYKKVASVNKNKTLISVKKYGKKKFIKGGKYYYYIVAKKKVGSTVFQSTLSRKFYFYA